MTKIEWASESLNCITGCTKVSPGCKNCYAEKMTKRLQAMGNAKYAAGWDKVVFHADALDVIDKWRKPRRVFVNSMSDSWHDAIRWPELNRMVSKFRKHPQHQFLMLTKRAARIQDMFLRTYKYSRRYWPDNVWVGVTIENADYMKRADELRRSFAKIKYLSLEPLLSPLPDLDLTDIDWVIVGGESGPGARPMEEDWVRDIVAQCKAAGVPVFYKQRMANGKKVSMPLLDGVRYAEYPYTRHTETIWCPECERVQAAVVEHSVPWFTYVHKCVGCGYLITESEWNAVKESVVAE
jgi:protein gp37